MSDTSGVIISYHKDGKSYLLSMPSEHVHWQGVIAADPDFSIPFATHIFIFHTREQLRLACESDEASAHSMTYAEPDSSGVGATMLFNLEDLALSLAAHEVAHVALVYHAHIEESRIGARRWLYEHPESVAEMTGNLTALVWAQICDNT